MEPMRRAKAVVVVGPTAVGKTAWGIEIARALGAEVLNADSRQFYRDIPIGTAQPTAEERAEVPHHFVGHLELEELYSAGDFQRDAVPWVMARPVSVVVGGSGLYLQALLDGLDEVPRDLAIREALNAEIQEHGLPKLVEELGQKDPVTARRIDASNPQRVVRALEVCRATGRPFSDFHRGGASERPFDALVIGIERPREELYARIGARVAAMVAEGFEEEARRVWPRKALNSLQTVGYREWFAHFEGELTRDEALTWIATRTRQFAKRQMTWFRRMPQVEWFGAEDLSAAVERARLWAQSPAS